MDSAIRSNNTPCAWLKWKNEGKKHSNQMDLTMNRAQKKPDEWKTEKESVRETTTTTTKIERKKMWRVRKWWAQRTQWKKFKHSVCVWCLACHITNVWIERCVFFRKSDYVSKKFDNIRSINDSFMVVWSILKLPVNPIFCDILIELEFRSKRKGKKRRPTAREKESKRVNENERFECENPRMNAKRFPFFKCAILCNV